MNIQCQPDWIKIELFFRGIWLKENLTQEEAIQLYKKYFEYRTEKTGAHLASIEICQKYKIEDQLENISMLVKLIGIQLASFYHKTLQTNIRDAKLKKEVIEKEKAYQNELGIINKLLIQLFIANKQHDTDPDKFIIEEIKIKTNKSKNYIRIIHKENISLFVNQLNNIPLTPLNEEFLNPDEFFRKRKVVTRRLRCFIHENTHFKPKNPDIIYSTTDECCKLMFDILKGSQVIPDSKLGDEVVTIRGILQEK